MIFSEASLLKELFAGDLDIRIAGRYRLGKRIGGGSFGDIYLATDVRNEEEFAVKLEQSNTKHPQLHTECKFYKVSSGTSVVLICI